MGLGGGLVEPLPIGERPGEAARRLTAGPSASGVGGTRATAGDVRDLMRYADAYDSHHS